MSLKIDCPRALLASSSPIPRRTARFPLHMKMSCFLLLNILQEQSYAKEMALMGQITVELAFILGMFPESAAPCSSQLQTIAITVIDSIFLSLFHSV